MTFVAAIGRSDCGTAGTPPKSVNVAKVIVDARSDADGMLPSYDPYLSDRLLRASGSAQTIFECWEGLVLALLLVHRVDRTDPTLAR